MHLHRALVLALLKVLVLREGAVGFVPGATGDGELLIDDLGFIGERVIRSAPLATLALHGTVGLTITTQAFTLQGGEVGISHAIDAFVGS